MESGIEASVRPTDDATRKAGALATPVFAAVVAAVLYAGWRARDGGALTPESGAGYALGVAGTAMMALMLLYPLRKHARLMRRWGAIRHWFRAHMVLGIIGPVCILFHCNFTPGSLNAKIALASMLIVVASGIAGRYLYAKIHHGLYGSRVTMAELRGRLTADAGRVSAHVNTDARLRARFATFEALAASEPRGLGASLLHVMRIAIAAAVTLTLPRVHSPGFGARRCDTAAQRNLVTAYLRSARRVAGFGFYERLFSLWHVLHVPLFVMLLITAVAHVVAVHRY